MKISIVVPPSFNAVVDAHGRIVMASGVSRKSNAGKAQWAKA